MSAGVRIRAVIIEGECDAATLAAIQSAIDAPETSVVYAAPATSEVVRRVAAETGQAARDIAGPLKWPQVVRARFAAAWVAKQFGTRSLSQIGAALGGRDHSTMIHALRRAEAMRESDPEFRALTDRVLAHFEQGDHVTGERP